MILIRQRCVDVKVTQTFNTRYHHHDSILQHPPIELSVVSFVRRAPTTVTASGRPFFGPVLKIVAPR